MSAEADAVRRFAQPDADHAPAAYWFWHRLPTAEEIRLQVRQMFQAGFRSFQIQARMSYPLEDYLDDAYLAACRYAAEQAHDLGMTIGVYDEYNWLSGHAGGRTVDGHDELRERHMFWSSADLSADGATCTVDRIRPTDVEHLRDAGRHWVFENGVIRWTDWEIVAVLAYPCAGATHEDQIVDVTAQATFAATGGDGCRVRVPPDAAGFPDARITVFVAARCASSRMINYLLPEAAERFTEVGYEPYRAAFGEHFGTTVRYMFFDQPHACFFRWAQHEGNVGASLMYADTLPAAFEERFGGSFRRALASLVADVGPRTPKLRCDFFATYSALGIDAFFGTLARWSAEHGVALSGHEVLGHVGSWNLAGTVITDDARTNFGMDYFALDRYRDITAVDARNHNPQLGAKLGDSVARSAGRSGCIVEQYFGRTHAAAHFAAGRWELTLAELRAQALRHHLLGARQFLFHAFYLTDGHPVDAGTDAQMFTNPRFDFAPGVNFEPWFAYHRWFAAESGRVSQFLDEARPACAVAVLYPLRTAWVHGPDQPYGGHAARWAEYLARGGHGFHFIDERDLTAAHVHDGALVVGDRRYPGLVLPAVSVLESDHSVDLIEEFTRTGGTVLASGDLPRATQRDGTDPGVEARMAAVFASCDRCVHLADAPSRDQVEDLVRRLRRGHLTVLDDDPESPVWRWIGFDDAGTRVALFNDSDAARHVTLRPAALPGTLTRWDPGSGEIEPWETPITGSAELALDPGEMACLHVTDGPEHVPDDIVLATGWTLRVGEEAPRPIDVHIGWQAQGLPHFSGTGEYRTVFDVEAAPTDEWELVLPGVRTAVEARLNGVLVGRRGWGPFRFRVPAPTLRASGNELCLRVASTAANRYYADSGQQGPKLDPSGLTAAPYLRAVTTTTTITHRPGAADPIG